MASKLRNEARFLLLVLALGGACGAFSVPEGRSLALTSASATIENGLPYDGCSFPVEIDGVSYAPDARSLDAIRAFGESFTGKTSVDVDYRLTGRTGQVECGWNTHQDLPEIEVVLKTR
jgi:hypothetical protein